MVIMSKVRAGFVFQHGIRARPKLIADLSPPQGPQPVSGFGPSSVYTMKSHRRSSLPSSVEAAKDQEHARARRTTALHRAMSGGVEEEDGAERLRQRKLEEALEAKSLRRIISAFLKYAHTLSLSVCLSLRAKFPHFFRSFMLLLSTHFSRIARFSFCGFM